MMTVAPAIMMMTLIAAAALTERSLTNRGLNFSELDGPTPGRAAARAPSPPRLDWAQAAGHPGPVTARLRQPQPGPGPIRGPGPDARPGRTPVRAGRWGRAAATPRRRRRCTY